MDPKLSYYKFVWKYMKSRFAHTPIWAHIFITYRCNLACPYCYLRKHRASDMPMDIFKSTLLGLKKVGCGLISFMGGEPTLNRDLSLMVMEARKAGMLTHLSTNGYLLTLDMINQLCDSGINIFNISIDSVSPSKTRPKSLDKVVDLLDILIKKRHQYGYSIYVTQVLQPDNLDQVSPMIKYLTERDINLQFAFVDKCISEGERGGLVGFDNDEMSSYLDLIISNLIDLKQKRYTISTSQRYLHEVRNFTYTGRVANYCLAGINNLQVDVDGHVRICSKHPSLELLASQLTPKLWQSLHSQMRFIVDKCNPTCLSACQFETAYIYQRPLDIIPSYLKGANHHLPR